MSDTLRPPFIRDAARTREARLNHTSASASIPGTPWAWYVEYPNAIILRPLSVLTWQTVLLGLVVLVLAIVAVALVSRGMTNSLADLTTTAESIAAGDLSRHTEAVEPSRRNRAAGAFLQTPWRTAFAIRDEQLERRIEERTGDLRMAMTRLRDTQAELVRKEKLAAIGPARQQRGP